VLAGGRPILQLLGLRESCPIRIALTIFFANVSNYLPFTRPVPFAQGQFYYETALKKADGSTNKGAFGRAVRVLPDQEYAQIWRAGFGHLIGMEPRFRPEPDVPEEPLSPLPVFADQRSTYSFETGLEADRDIVTQLVSRPFRDRAFSAAVKSAYSDTCAISGLKIINGGGRSEVQAAHIKPVADLGPDSVRNGIALSGTVHWMFDRGLISIDDNHDVLFAKDRISPSAMKLLSNSQKLALPLRPDLQPHPMFLAYHRNHVFKG
jgi:putative restriction endonuclease